MCQTSQTRGPRDTRTLLPHPITTLRALSMCALQSNQLSPTLLGSTTATRPAAPMHCCTAAAVHPPGAAQPASTSAVQLPHPHLDPQLLSAHLFVPSPPALRQRLTLPYTSTLLQTCRLPTLLTQSRPHWCDCHGRQLNTTLYGRQAGTLLRGPGPLMATHAGPACGMHARITAATRTQTRATCHMLILTGTGKTKVAGTVSLALTASAVSTADITKCSCPCLTLV